MSEKDLEKEEKVEESKEAVDKEDKTDDSRLIVILFHAI